MDYLNFFEVLVCGLVSECDPGAGPRLPHRSSPSRVPVWHLARLPGVAVPHGLLHQNAVTNVGLLRVLEVGVPAKEETPYEK